MLVYVKQGLCMEQKMSLLHRHGGQPARCHVNLAFHFLE